MCIFPRLVSVTCFPARQHVSLAKRWLHVFGSSSSDDYNWFWLFKPKENTHKQNCLSKSNGKYFSAYAIADVGTAWSLVITIYLSAPFQGSFDASMQTIISGHEKYILATLFQKLRK